MKNITAFAVLVIIFVCAPSAYAQESVFSDSLASPASPRKISAGAKPYTLQAGSQIGFLWGQCEEIVFPINTRAELLSQLLWDLKPLWYYGMTLDFSRADPFKQWGFFSALSLKNGIPALSGIMEDRDWASIQNDALTHYSHHDNETRELVWLDFSAGVSIPFRPFFLLKAYTAVSYMRFAFSGLRGFGTYARGNPNSGIYFPITDNPDKVDFAAEGYEKVINYTQDWLLVAPGVSLLFRPVALFSLGVSFRITPLLVCGDLDEHLTTSAQYRDYSRFGLFLEPGVEEAFYLGEWVVFSIGLSWRYSTGARGETYKRSYGAGNYERLGEAGAGLSLVDTAFLFKVRL